MDFAFLRRGMAAACLLFSSGILAAPETLDTADFARHAAYERVKISPNGEYLAVSAPIDESTGLAVIRLKDMAITASVRLGHQEHVGDFWWTGPDRVLISQSRSGGRRGNLRSTGELSAINADGTGSRYLFGYRGEDQTGSHLRKAAKVRASATVIDPLADDPNWALIAVNFWDKGADNGYASIERINVKTGFRAKQATSPLDGWPRYLADHTGELRYVSGEDQNLKHRMYYRTAGAEQWSEVRKDDIRDPYPLAISRDGSRAYLAVRNESGLQCLYEHLLAPNNFRQLSCDQRSDLRHVVMSFDGKRAIGASFHDSSSPAVLLKSGHPDEATLKAIIQGFAGQQVDVVSTTRDGRQLVLEVSSDQNPGDYYLFDTQQRSAAYLISARVWIDPQTQAKRQPFEVRSKDGVALQGFLTLPPGKPARQLPTVVMPHGGPIGIRDDWRWDPLPQFLAHHGYAVIQVNFRGSSGYGKPFREMGFQAWGTGMIDDITAATRWAIQQGVTDPQRICIAGASYGGYAALMSAIRDPDLYRCVSGFVGIYDLEGIGDDTDNRDSVRWSTLELEQIGDAATRRLQSPMRHLDKLKAPMLIVHGGLDRRAPIRHAKHLRDALEKRDHPHEWLVKNTEGHGFYRTENRVIYYDTLLDFVDRHIGKAPPP